MPKVSIVVPIYNVEKYLEKCLKSLSKQTLQEIEVIMINDGSTDNSIKIAKRYQNEFPNKFKYFEKENGGLSDARNFGMKYVTGEYTAFLDSDDYVEKDTYELLYNKAITSKADYVECDFIWEYPNKMKEDIRLKYNSKKEMLLYARVVAWNKLIKTSLLLETNIKFPKGLRYEDIEFFYKLIPYIKIFEYVDKPLIHYIQRETSIANTQNISNREIFNIFENVFTFYKEQNFYNEYKNELEYTYTRILLCSSLLRISKIQDNKIRKTLLNETYKNLSTKFPNWRKNIILKNDNSKKGIYMKSINDITYKIYSIMFKYI